MVFDAAIALIIRMLSAAKTRLTRAEHAIIGTGPAYNVHPALLTPFVVIGEGDKLFKIKERVSASSFIQ